MNRETALHVFDRARLECALAPRVARALGVPAKQAAQLAFEIPPRDLPGGEIDHPDDADGRPFSVTPYGSFHLHAVTVDAIFQHGVPSELRPFRLRHGVAVGKCAAAMAWGAGAMTAGLCISNGPPVALPDGWRYVMSAHPVPDERSVDAGRLVRELVDNATDEDVVVALISGGASAMLEEPRVPLAELRAIASTLMAAGLAIGELNVVRSALSSIKGGKLALDCGARIVTLVASDIVNDRLELVGSGPTIGPWLDEAQTPADFGAVEEGRRTAAIAILERHGLAVPDVLRMSTASKIVTRGDHAQLVSKMRDFADAYARGLRHAGTGVTLIDRAMRGDITDVADQLVAATSPTMVWGEPTLRLPSDHGQGGRMQQLALELARRLAGSRRRALAIGTDGMDGPQPVGFPWAAGAFVDGGTWGELVAGGHDPERALRRCDAGPALAAIGASVFTGPTHVNHADIVVVV